MAELSEKPEFADAASWEDMCDIFDHEEKRLCLIGVTGSGKSTLGNILLGLGPDQDESSYGFATGSDADSVTQKVETIHGFWRGDKNRAVRVVDTPGHGDNKGRDEENRRNFIDGMAGEREIDAFIWVKNAQQPRYDSLHQEFFSLFVAMFGPAFYRNLIVVFTHWGFSNKEERKRRGKTLEETKNQLWASICEGHGAHCFVPSTNPIPMVAIDALYDESDITEKTAFEAQLEELWSVVNNFSRLPVMDLRMVQDKKAALLSQLEEMEKAHKEEREQLVKEKEELELAAKQAEASAAVIASLEERSKKLKIMDEQKRRLTEKIKMLEKASRAPWWLTLIIKVGEVLASAGLQHIVNNNKHLQQLASSKEMQKRGFFGHLTGKAAQALLEKYVNVGSEDDALKAAYEFMGLDRAASEEEVDQQYELLRAKFDPNNKLGGGDRNKFDELQLAVAKIKAALFSFWCDVPGYPAHDF